MTLDLLEQEIQQGSDELDARRAALGARLADAYRSQGTSLLEQVLDSGSFTDVVSNASAYLAYGDQDAQLAAAIAAGPGIARLAARGHRRHPLPDRPAAPGPAGLRRSTCKAQKAVLADGQGQAPQAGEADQGHPAQAAGQGAPDRRQPATGAGRTSGASRPPTASSRTAVAGLLAAAKRAAEPPRRRGGSGGGSGNGRFSWPTVGHRDPGVRLHRLLPGAASRVVRPLPHRHRHRQLVRAPRSTPRAMGWWRSPAGRTAAACAILIGHAGTSPPSTATCHAASVHAGQRVHRGQIIGYMGKTGNATGPHLHFEVQRGDTPVNPRAYT